jgi:hypothetical protein
MPVTAISLFLPGGELCNLVAKVLAYLCGVKLFKT